MTATPDTPQPPGSQRVDGWETNAGKTFRYFAGQPRGSAAEVKIGGFQGVVTPNPSHRQHRQLGFVHQHPGGHWLIGRV
jgi:hypothetical protein